MKAIKLIIGVLAVVTSLVLMPKPKFNKPTSWVDHYKVVNAIDSMEFENKMYVLSK